MDTDTSNLSIDEDVDSNNVTQTEMGQILTEKDGSSVPSSTLSSELGAFNWSKNGIIN